jgi:hypothetical protein
VNPFPTRESCGQPNIIRQRARSSAISDPALNYHIRSLFIGLALISHLGFPPPPPSRLLRLPKSISFNLLHTSKFYRKHLYPISSSWSSGESGILLFYIDSHFFPSLFNLFIIKVRKSIMSWSGVLSARYRQRTAGSESWSCGSQGTSHSSNPSIRCDGTVIRFYTCESSCGLDHICQWIRILDNRDSSQGSERQKF